MKLNKKLLIILVLLAAASGAGFWFWQRAAMKNAAELARDAKAPDKIFTVKRGDLIVGVLLTGNVNTKVKHKLALDVPISTKLVAIVDENTKVSKGDIVARFETEDLQIKIDDGKVELDNKEKDLLIYQEERSILISSNEADIRTAEDNVVAAQDAYNKYLKLEGPRDKDNQLMSVSDAQKTLGEARETYNNAYDELYKSGGTVPKETEKAQLESALKSAEKSLNSAQVKYSSALLDRKIFKRYTHPTKIKELKNKLEQTKLELNKVKVKTASSLAQKDNQIYNAEQNMRKIERELERNLTYMCSMQLVAPTDGIVTYGDPDRRWGNLEVKIGMDVRRREVLITIPDMSQMIVNINIPEQYRSKVRTGGEVIITPDSIPNLKIPGKIERIDSLPVLLIPWDNGSPKVYRATVDFEMTDPRIVSGMSVQVEAVSQILKDVISVPIEAVQEEGGKFFVYRETLTRPETAPVELGVANDSFVEIKSGLQEGDEIYLYRPFQTSQKD